MSIDQFNQFVSSSKDFSFENGIWYSANYSWLSYPEESYSSCFELEESSFWFRHRNNCLLSVIEYFSEKECFFDVGGGMASLQRQSRMSIYQLYWWNQVG
jgi:hypothetical protein